MQSSLLHAVQETLHGQPLAQVLAHLTRDLSHQSVGARPEQGGMSPSFVRQLAKEVLRQFQEIDSRREPIAQPVTQREGTSSLWREAIQYLQREARSKSGSLSTKQPVAQPLVIRARRDEAVRASMAKGR